MARVAALYGGVGYRDQESVLRRGVHVAVATPGRLLDLVTRRSLDLSKVRVLVLDEADRLLDLGFAPDIARIVALLSGPRQTALFSATLTADVRAIAKRYTTDPATVAVRPERPTVDAIDQAWIEVREADRVGARHELLGRSGVERTLVFRRTKHGADKLVKALDRLGRPARALHGNVGQRERERVLEGFRRGTIRTLVATNLAARGLHVDDIGHVVNFDLPENADTYVHRVGRTGVPVGAASRTPLSTRCSARTSKTSGARRKSPFVASRWRCNAGLRITPRRSAAVRSSVHATGRVRHSRADREGTAKWDERRGSVSPTCKPRTPSWRVARSAVPSASGRCRRPTECGSFAASGKPSRRSPRSTARAVAPPSASASSPLPKAGRARAL